MIRIRGVEIPVPVRVLPHGEDLELPSYATPGAAGFDLRAAVSTELVVAPGGRTLVPTGIAVAIPDGYEGQVRMRSGLALKKGLILPNAPGTIDSDYRGELCVVVANIGAEPVVIVRGDRIAQLVVSPVVRAALERVGELPATGRSSGGFGSTGEK